MNNIDEKYALLLHMSRVSEMAYRMAHLFGLEERNCKEIAIAAHLHDVGKFLVNPMILNKTEKLTEAEKTSVMEHVDFSYIIGHMMSNRLTPDILRMIFEHHENYDGTGYPKGKKGDQMLLGSHIVKICDAYDAMRSERPYRKAMTRIEAFDEIMRHRNQYNQECINCLAKLEKIEHTAEAV